MKNPSIKFSTKEQALLFKRLSFLLGADVSLEESFATLSKQSKSKKEQNFFNSVHKSISAGSYLSTSLAQYNKTFSNFVIHIIKISEEIGSLTENLQYISEELLKRNSLKNKIVAALIYPLFIAVGTIVLSGFILFFMFPKIRPLFTQMKVSLPLSTRILIYISDFLKNYGFYLFLLITGLTLLFLFLIKKNQKLKYYKDLILLKIPLVGTILRNYAMATIMRTLGIILKSGIPAHQALTIAAETAPSFIYKKVLLQSALKVAAGEAISLELSRHSSLFPTMAITMISVAERAGTLSETMLYLSHMYEQEVDEAAKNLSSSLEPILMTTMGLVVGFISLSIITPIYTITQNLKH